MKIKKKNITCSSDIYNLAMQYKDAATRILENEGFTVEDSDYETFNDDGSFRIDLWILEWDTITAADILKDAFRDDFRFINCEASDTSAYNTIHVWFYQ